MHPNHPAEVEPGAFPALMLGGIAAIVLSFAVPLDGGGGGQTVFEVDPAGAAKVLAVFGIPIVVGALQSRRNPVMAGVAAGAAMLLGASISLVWSVSLGIAWAFGGNASVSAGLVVMAVGSLALVAGGVLSVKFRHVGRSHDYRPSPVARLGVVSGLLTVVGILIPPKGYRFDDWTGFSAYPIFGAAFLLVIGVFLFVGIGAFLGSRWGVGLMAGFAGSFLLLTLLSENQQGLLAEMARSGQEPHVLAKVGFVSMIALFGIHSLQELGSSSPRTSSGSGPGPHSAAHPARWADDPFGRHQSRYWDGGQWSDHVADSGTLSRDSPTTTSFNPPALLQPLGPPGLSQNNPATFRVGAPHTAAGEHDGRTMRRTDLETTRKPTARAVVLVFDDGQRTQMRGAIVVGRDPMHLPQTPGAELVSVADSTMSVSKTHFAIGPDAAGVWVEDVGSANGTSVAAPSGEEFNLIPGARMAVPVGSTVQFGERSVRVEWRL
jgi:Protein of unknown function (DUF2510)/FHA domain